MGAGGWGGGGGWWVVYGGEAVFWHPGVCRTLRAETLF